MRSAHPSLAFSMCPPGRAPWQALRRLKADLDPELVKKLCFRFEPLDVMCCRFLRARQFDVKAAREMMEAAVVRTHRPAAPPPRHSAHGFHLAAVARGVWAR